MLTGSTWKYMFKTALIAFWMLNIQSGNFFKMIVSCVKHYPQEIQHFVSVVFNIIRISIVFRQVL